MSAPLISVVLPVRNEARDLPALLEQLRRQTPPPGGFEVLAVDGGSTDGTRDLVRDAAAGWPALRLLDNPRRRSAPARNVGAMAAAGSIVLFIDGHCSLPRRDHLVRVAEIFEATGADCLCRPQPLDELAHGSWGDAVALARHSRLGHAPGSDIYGGEARFTDPHSAGAAYRRRVFERIGGFDERFDACEDVEFNHRVAAAGFRSYVHPDLAVHYRPRESLGAFLRQMFRYGRGRGRLAVRHPALTSRILVLASAMLLAAPFLLILPGGRAGAGLLLGGAAAWIGLCAAEGMRLGGCSARGVRTAAALAVVHLGLTLGFLRGLLDFRRYRGPAVSPGGSSGGNASAG